MNRLILIGNGFDLAHGMKTSYSDFLLDYLKDAFKQAKEAKEYSDELMSIYKTSHVDHVDISKIDSIKGFQSYNVHSNHIKSEDLSPERIDSFKRSAGVPYICFFHYKFIRQLFDAGVNTRWVDIENEYYQDLIRIIQDQNSSDAIIELNKAFKFIIELVTEYISRQKFKDDGLHFINNPISHILISPLDIDNFVTLKEQERIDLKASAKMTPFKTLILNFNYTNTISKYLSSSFITDKLGYPEVINIHGNRASGIIFGFGDELDVRYPMIERANNNEFLRYIKSFGYFRNDNYRSLIRFIESELFEVFIWGHSCGLSDRTMLNMVFEDKNCKSIKIFHHRISNSENNYITLTQEISRHFTNKAQMRKKIVPFNEMDYLPQFI